MTILSIRKFNGEIPQLPADRIPQYAAVDHGAAEGGFSREATDFLLTLASEADSAVIQLEACHAWARSLGGATHD